MISIQTGLDLCRYPYRHPLIPVVIQKLGIYRIRCKLWVRWVLGPGGVFGLSQGAVREGGREGGRGFFYAVGECRVLIEKDMETYRLKCHR